MIVSGTVEVASFNSVGFGKKVGSVNLKLVRGEDKIVKNSTRINEVLAPAGFPSVGAPAVVYIIETRIRFDDQFDDAPSVVTTLESSAPAILVNQPGAPALVTEAIITVDDVTKSGFTLRVNFYIQSNSLVSAREFFKDLLKPNRAGTHPGTNSIRVNYIAHGDD